jgi:hypothetical protein
LYTIIINVVAVFDVRDCALKGCFKAWLEAIRQNYSKGLLLIGWFLGFGFSSFFMSFYVTNSWVILLDSRISKFTIWLAVAVFRSPSGTLRRVQISHAFVFFFNFV